MRSACALKQTALYCHDKFHIVICLFPRSYLTGWRKQQTVDHLSPVHTSNNVEATLSNATKSTVATTKLVILLLFK